MHLQIRVGVARGQLARTADTCRLQQVSASANGDVETIILYAHAYASTAPALTTTPRLPVALSWLAFATTETSPPSPTIPLPTPPADNHVPNASTPPSAPTHHDPTPPPPETLLALVAGTGLAARMPEKPLTIATYAAGASLAAITLVYVFGPTFFLDDEAAHSSRSARKKGVVGLVNPANDCFINSVLQALAGLPELRIYLIREMHRRRLDGPDIYKDLTAALEEQERHPERKQQLPEWKLLGMQQGLITAGLKEVLDALNERPIYKKTISAQGFIRVVERVFRTRISRSQQDAQEFLQIVAERLAEEYAAGRRVRRRVRGRQLGGEGGLRVNGDASAGLGERTARDSVHSEPTDVDREPESVVLPPAAAVEAALSSVPAANGTIDNDKEDQADREPPDGASDDDGTPDPDESFGFPFEGKLESIVECSHCHFKPKPHTSSFVTLTLHVPQTNSTLNACFDGMLKVEHIEGYTCDRCRLDHALQLNAKALSKTSLSRDERQHLEHDRQRIEHALSTDPETPPKDLHTPLPSLATAPKRRIARHMRIARFPRILSLHLSRSVWDSTSSSSKNSAKVSFPETLPLGGLLDRKTYRLLGVVTHKGAHNSGHYESFRRQVLASPVSSRVTLGREGVFSLRGTPVGSPRLNGSPRLEGRGDRSITVSSGTSELNPSALSSSGPDSPTSLSSDSHARPLDRRKTQPPPPTSAPLDDAIPTPGLPPSPPPVNSTALPAAGPDTGTPKRQSSFSGAINRVKQGTTRKKGGPHRWWRISDDKVKESKTGDVLGMQREVYLLFYEVVEEG